MRAIRKQLNMTQLDLALYLKRSIRQIRRWETGEVWPIPGYVVEAMKLLESQIVP